jgi:hypothetical protein
MRLVIEMETEGAAFEGCPEDETARILREYADRIERNGFNGFQDLLRDVNGNTVGTARVEE